MLTGPEIERQVALGRIVIDPWSNANVGPNSVDVHLHPEIAVYAVFLLDAKVNNPVARFAIPATGYVLRPGRLYLARTVERTYTPFHVPQISGRSSIGRLGIRIHATAGFGDVGFDGTWTLEIDVVYPVRVYPGLRIAQVYFSEPVGELRQYAGSYQGQVNATPSRMHRP